MCSLSRASGGNGAHTKSRLGWRLGWVSIGGVTPIECTRPNPEKVKNKSEGVPLRNITTFFPNREPSTPNPNPNPIWISGLGSELGGDGWERGGPPNPHWIGNWNHWIGFNLDHSVALNHASIMTNLKSPAWLSRWTCWKAIIMMTTIINRDGAIVHYFASNLNPARYLGREETLLGVRLLGEVLQLLQDLGQLRKQGITK